MQSWDGMPDVPREGLLHDENSLVNLHLRCVVSRGAVRGTRADGHV